MLKRYNKIKAFKNNKSHSTLETSQTVIVPSLCPETSSLPSLENYAENMPDSTDLSVFSSFNLTISQSLMVPS